jgi:multicomponent Na+:H+ antiporter subunit F
MSAAAKILDMSIWVGLVLLLAAFLLTVWRVVKGPTLPDRVVALDMLVGIVIGFIALIAIRNGFTLYVDIAIALGLVGFLATVAFARFILSSAGAKADPGELTRTVVPAIAAKLDAKPNAKPKSKAKPAVKIAGEADNKPAAKRRKPEGDA